MDLSSKLEVLQSNQKVFSTGRWTYAMEQTLLLDFVSQLSTKVKAFYRTDGETDITASHGEGGKCKNREGNSNPESYPQPTTLNELQAPRRHLQKSPACVCVSWCSPPLFLPSAVWLLWLPPFSIPGVSLSSVSLIYILSSDQRTRWIHSRLTPTRLSFYPCSWHQPLNPPPPLLASLMFNS